VIPLSNSLAANGNVVNANIQQEVFFNVEGDGSKWIEDHESIPEFKMGLWGLDALYKLQRSLKESVGSILQAKVELLAQINEVNSHLPRVCGNYSEIFTFIGPRQAE
jgi:hypothetical protein